uniref:Uncharacterized protein n=1 Tax=Pararge aegeria TaxID=116150 RepID=S4NL91_9NEOP
MYGKTNMLILISYFYRAIPYEIYLLRPSTVFRYTVTRCIQLTILSSLWAKRWRNLPCPTPLGSASVAHAPTIG